MPDRWVHPTWSSHPSPPNLSPLWRHGPKVNCVQPRPSASTLQTSEIYSSRVLSHRRRYKYTMTDGYRIVLPFSALYGYATGDIHPALLDRHFRIPPYSALPVHPWYRPFPIRLGVVLGYSRSGVIVLDCQMAISMGTHACMTRTYCSNQSHVFHLNDVYNQRFTQQNLRWKISLPCVHGQ